MLIHWHISPTDEQRKLFTDLAFLANQESPHSPYPWPLPNMTPTTARDFWKWNHSWGFRANAWCGTRRIGDSWANVAVFLANVAELMDGGFVVTSFYSGPRRDETDYHRWSGCAHDFDEKNTANCEHTYTCRKCKRAFSVDSSD